MSLCITSLFSLTQTWVNRLPVKVCLYAWLCHALCHSGIQGWYGLVAWTIECVSAVGILSFTTFHQRVRTCSSYRWPLWYLCGDIEDDGYVEWYLRYNWSSFLSKYYKSWMWETEIVENCGNVVLTIASCSIFSELRESLISVVKLCSWTWSRKKCVSTVHRDEWVRMEVWDEMCNLDRACCSDASVCENRRIHMWVLLNVTVTEWFDIRTVIFIYGLWSIFGPFESFALTTGDGWAFSVELEHVPQLQRWGLYVQ